MKKIDITGRTGVRLISILVVLCILIGFFSVNSMKLFATSYLLRNGQSASAAVNNTPAQNNNNNGGNNGNGSANNNNGGGNNSSDNNGQGVTSGALPTTEAPATEAPATEAPATEAPATEAPATEAPATEEPSTEAPADETTTTTKPTTTEPVTDSPEVAKAKKDILTIYKKVVNAANTTRAGFTKVEYRTASKDTLGKIGLGKLESNYSDYFISESTARENPTVVAPFSETDELGAKSVDYACLADAKLASDILKSATKESQEGGSIKITLVLRDEVNPAENAEDAKTAASFHAAFFPVMEQNTFKDMIKNTSLLAKIKLDSAKLTYADSTIVLEYMPLTGRIVSLTHTVKYTAECTNFSISSFDIGTKTQVTDITEYTDFNYGIL